LRWSSIPDLDSTDGKTPICIPPQDAPLFSAIVQRFLQEDISESQKIMNGYNSEISELKEKLLHSSSEEKKLIQTKIENIEQARDELMGILDGKKALLDDGRTLSFQDYLSHGVGTEFEKDPEKAIAELEKGVEIGPSFSARDCFRPIREKALMPDSAIRFYVPEMGVSVTRKFEVENGLVHSDYSFTSDKGEQYDFSDRGITLAEWNKSVLPIMLDKAGILEDTKCRMFDTEESLNAYVKYHNNVKLKSEEYAVKLGKDGKLVFSSAEVEKEIRSACENRLKGMASAEVSTDGVTSIQIFQKDVYSIDGKIAVKVGDDTFKLSGVKFEKIADDPDKMQISLSKDSDVIVTNLNGEERQISVTKLKDAVDSSKEKSIQNLVDDFVAKNNKRK
jgi:hypothetical protein